jgi:hypothetical protein
VWANAKDFIEDHQSVKVREVEWLAEVRHCESLGDGMMHLGCRFHAEGGGSAMGGSRSHP